MENITQYFVPERDPWYNKGFQKGAEKGFQKGEAKGEVKGKAKGEEEKKRDFTVRLLLKTELSDELIATLADASIEYVRTIKNELTQIRLLLETKNSITKNRK